MKDLLETYHKDVNLTMENLLFYTVENFKLDINTNKINKFYHTLKKKLMQTNLV